MTDMNNSCGAIQDVSKVPGRTHYGFNYLRGGRVFSYAHQIDAALSFEPSSVLEIGVGTGMVSAALRAAGVEVTTADVQPELAPDIAASVTDLPVGDGSFDVAICCQVLEHLPFEQFASALRELRRVTSEGLVLSLPDASPFYEVRLRLPKLRNFHWTGTRRRDPGGVWKARKWEGDGHYWEIGYSEYPLDRVTKAISAVGWRIVRTWRVSEMRYHRFFLLRNGGRG